jgi:hypothetical protein
MPAKKFARIKKILNDSSTKRTKDSDQYFYKTYGKFRALRDFRGERKFFPLVYFMTPRIFSRRSRL